MDRLNFWVDPIQSGEQQQFSISITVIPGIIFFNDIRQVAPTYCISSIYGLGRRVWFMPTACSSSCNVRCQIQQSIHRHQTPPHYRNAASARSGRHTSPYGPLRPNMTSSIKPEVHNVSQCRQRRTEPRPQGICTKNREDRSSGSRDMLADRQTHTDRQTDRQTN